MVNEREPDRWPTLSEYNGRGAPASVCGAAVGRMLFGVTPHVFDALGSVGGEQVRPVIRCRAANLRNIRGGDALLYLKLTM